MTTKARQKSKPNVKVFENLDEISRFAADTFIKVGNSAIKKTGRFAVALAGGSTPTNLYRLLSGDNYASKIEWDKVFFFLGDERDVSPMSEMSNFRTINETLFSKLPIPKSNIYRWQTEIINAPEVAESYERTIKKFFQLKDCEAPKFDLILLGMGDDGHTASLFPFTDALSETDKLAVSNYVEKLDANRLSVTFPVINNAANVLFLVSGEGKARTLKEVFESKQNYEKLPSQAVQLKKGRLLWLIDESAAQHLS